MGSACPETVSLVLSVLNEDVCVVFSFETSMLYGRCHVKWNGYDKRVLVNFISGMVS